MKLISMTDFVLEQNKIRIYKILKAEKTNEIEFVIEADDDFIISVTNYANFLKQPLKLEMFVPCDDEGNVLEEPYLKSWHNDNCYCKRCEDEIISYNYLMAKFEQAKEKVLFEGFEWDGWWKDINFKNISMNVKMLNEKTIEDLTKYEPKLTQAALKQIRL